MAALRVRGWNWNAAPMRIGRLGAVSGHRTCTVADVLDVDAVGQSPVRCFSSAMTRDHTWRLGAPRPGGPVARTFHTTAVALAAKRDPYDVLGVPRSASKDEVKKSYYKLVKK